MRLPSLIIAIFLLALPVYAQTILGVQRGGTGSTTLSGLLKGNGIGSIQTAVAGVDYLLSSTVAWGAITGTLSNQTDLQTALNTKEAILSFNYPLSRLVNAISTVATSSLGLTTSSFASANISQWTNNSAYLTGSGHSTYTGTTPTVSSCGTNPTNYGTDARGRIYVGSGITVTSCTLTFAASWTNAPVCSVTQETGTSVAIEASSTLSALVISTTATVINDAFTYRCDGY